MTKLSTFKSPNLTIPREAEVWVGIPCCVEEHNYDVTSGKTVGALFLNLRELGDYTTQDILKSSKKYFQKRVGCGVKDCPVTLRDAIGSCALPEFLQCVHHDCNLVEVRKGECDSHGDVGLGELIGNSVRKFFRVFHDTHRQVRTAITKGGTDASAEMLEVGSRFPGVDS